ncbi:MAG: toll/interleukin-1 receptor domain-containing protein, partial [Deltaproteobacteria bacterium]|nr:toll/interleukin-1 receptor domain-containing protein [Deltaproteobacteria bacterium]
AHYSREFEDLQQMIDYGEEQLEKGPSREIVFKRLSVGSFRYLKAAFIYAAWYREEEINKITAKGTWPSGVVEAMRGKVKKFHEFASKILYEPAPILEELRPDQGQHPQQSSQDTTWDVFISHASEDKEVLARELAERLRVKGVRVWYDEFTLRLGDSLRRSIDRGLAHSRFGLIILSPSFFRKEWPQKELDGLVAREVEGRKVILPIWHEVNSVDIRKYSPILADRIAISSSVGIENVVNAIISAMS